MVLCEDFHASAELAEVLKDIVRQNVVGHDVPRTIEFLDESYMKTTGIILCRELLERGHKFVG